MKLVNRFLFLSILAGSFISADEKKKALVELNTGTN